MEKRLSFIVLKRAVIDLIKKNTVYDIFDAVPKDYQGVHYAIGQITHEPVRHKTMHRTQFMVPIHIFTPPDNGSSLLMDKAIVELEEALTEFVDLPEEYQLVHQEVANMAPAYEMEDGYKQSILTFQFDVFHGYKMKI